MVVRAHGQPWLLCNVRLRPDLCALVRGTLGEQSTPAIGGTYSRAAFRAPNTGVLFWFRLAEILHLRNLERYGCTGHRPGNGRHRGPQETEDSASFAPAFKHRGDRLLYVQPYRIQLSKCAVRDTRAHLHLRDDLLDIA